MKQKQKCVERDYTAELENEDFEIKPEHKVMAREVDKYLKYVETLPHAVDTYAARRFDEMVEACDLIAKEFSGKMRATVDYEHYWAQIQLECVYVEFVRDEFMETLRKLAAYADSIEFLPLTSGFLRVDVSMPYFQRVRDFSLL